MVQQESEFVFCKYQALKLIHSHVWHQFFETSQDGLPQLRRFMVAQPKILLFLGPLGPWRCMGVGTDSRIFPSVPRTEPVEIGCNHVYQFKYPPTIPSIIHLYKMTAYKQSSTCAYWLASHPDRLSTIHALHTHAHTYRRTYGVHTDI